jgi:lactate dehydrogenase-like 2-hydroxyacid dehydrogenase
MTPERTPRVFLAVHLSDTELARIEAECSVRRYEGRGFPSKSDLIAGIADAEGLLGSAVLPVDAEVLESAPSLRVVSNVGVGYDRVDLEAATRRGVMVCNTPGVLSAAVADLTIALIISLARRIPEADRFVREGNWVPGRFVGLGMDIVGKTLGIVGLGRIGRAVALRAHALGMDVCFHDKFRVEALDSAFWRYRELDELLQESDFVTLHVNLTEETTKLIGERELGLMKQSAYLLNTSRGPVVDQAALASALREERIAGAALDVLEREPPSPDDPILGLPNALIVPHIASATRETRQAMVDLAIDNLLWALRGELLDCIVNTEVLGAQTPRR